MDSGRDRLFSDRKAADDIAESLQKDSSTKNLLNAVKTVLAVTKQERKYDQWMHRSFEVNRVTNQNLAETLKTFNYPGCFRYHEL